MTVHCPFMITIIKMAVNERPKADISTSKETSRIEPKYRLQSAVRFHNDLITSSYLYIPMSYILYQYMKIKVMGHHFIT